MKFFKSHEYKKAEKELKLINDLAPKYKKMSDEQLKEEILLYKKDLLDGKPRQNIRVHVYAISREATERILKKRPFDVQMIGAIILDLGSVAEMKTGEGKTITSIMPVVLNALEEKSVIVATVNEYLSQRDAEELGEVYNFLGLSVGVNLRELNSEEKREAYNKDITYSVHSEIGFDYLRDNMVSRPEEKVQRKLSFALIDEVDSILIDEAKTPLIISGGSASGTENYARADAFVKSLSGEDYDIDLESKGIQLNNKGTDKANKFFNTGNIFSVENSELVLRIQNSLRANKIMNKDADYIIRDGEVLIVDAFTGRVMEGRSYSDGLHQAIQAKENVEIEPETVTLATITYQNLFRMFSKLSGMSGTAKTEEEEFLEIYNMRVHVIPTNEPLIREDLKDAVFVSTSAKYKAIVEEVKKTHKIGQPILLGTEEVSESEIISQKLSKENIKHTVLNAKQNESEAEIISKAGEKGAVTIATNMAGRGTDIKPTKEALAVGGVYVLGTSKAEARRIDNQLIGRSGRQGDIGKSKFFLSLDDKLISRFSNQEKLKKMFSEFGDNKIDNKQVNKALKRAQIRIEGFNFDARKNILQFDDVIRQQRDLIYSQRDIIIGQPNLKNVIERMIKSVVKEVLVDFSNFKKPDGSYDIPKIGKTLNEVWFSMTDYKIEPLKLEGLSIEKIISVIEENLIKQYNTIREKVIFNISEEGMQENERTVLLETFDANWTMHIDQMQKLKSSTSLASYAQQNPYQQYVTKGTVLFNELLKRISHNTVRLIMNNPLSATMSEFVIEESEIDSE